MASASENLISNANFGRRSGSVNRFPKVLHNSATTFLGENKGHLLRQSTAVTSWESHANPRAHVTPVSVGTAFLIQRPAVTQQHIGQGLSSAYLAAGPREAEDLQPKCMGSGRDKRKKAKGTKAGQGADKTARKTEKNAEKAVRRTEKEAEVVGLAMQFSPVIVVCGRSTFGPPIWLFYPWLLPLVNLAVKKNRVCHERSLDHRSQANCCIREERMIWMRYWSSSG